MVSIRRIFNNDQEILDLVGLSTDEKPTQKFKGHYINNGCDFVEFDTGKIYFFDKTQMQWIETPGGGSTIDPELESRVAALEDANVLGVNV